MLSSQLERAHAHCIEPCSARGLAERCTATGATQHDKPLCSLVQCTQQSTTAEETSRRTPPTRRPRVSANSAPLHCITHGPTQPYSSPSPAQQPVQLQPSSSLLPAQEKRPSKAAHVAAGLSGVAHGRPHSGGGARSTSSRSVTDRSVAPAVLPPCWQPSHAGAAHLQEARQGELLHTHARRWGKRLGIPRDSTSR